MNDRKENMFLKDLNVQLKNKETDNRSKFSEASTSGYYFGKSIIEMIDSLNMSDEEKDDFLKGLNKIIFKEIRLIYEATRNLPNRNHDQENYESGNHRDRRNYQEEDNHQITIKRRSDSF